MKKVTIEYWAEKLCAEGKSVFVASQKKTYTFSARDNRAALLADDVKSQYGQLLHNLESALWFIESLVGCTYHYGSASVVEIAEIDEGDTDG